MKEEQNKNELPQGWKWQRLEDALDFVIGGDWGKDENFNDPNYGQAYCIRGAEIKNWNEEKGRTATLRKVKLSNIAKRKLIEGDILVEISGGGPEQPVGRTVLIDKSALSYKTEVPKICTNFLRLIRPKHFVNSKFLNFYLKLFYHSGEIVKYQAGSNNLRNLKFPDYVKINFPLPPKEIQQLIVFKIEELFSKLDKGIEELKSAQKQLKVYRQAVLKWAFEGKLTNEDVRDGGLPEGWEIKCLGKVSEMCLGKMLDKQKNKGTLKPYLGNINVRWGDFDLSDLKEMKFEGPEQERFGLRKGDLVVCEGGEPGRCAVWKYDENVMIQKALHRVRVSENVNVKYVFYFFNYSALNGSLEKYFTGTTIKHLTGKELKKVELPLPSYREQQQIVQELESRLSVCDKIEETITHSLKQAEALRQSILKKSV